MRILNKHIVTNKCFGDLYTLYMSFPPQFMRNTFEANKGMRAVLLNVSAFRAGPRSAVGRAPDSQVRGPGFDIRSGHIFSFLLPLIQEGQLSVTGKSMSTKYWLTAAKGV